MPNDVKAAVSAITLAVALVLALERIADPSRLRELCRHRRRVYDRGGCGFFPKAGGKKRNPKRVGPNGTKAAP